MNTGQIIKSKTTERFTTVPNEIVRSTILSLEEKGLLIFLLSLPSDWVLYKTNLKNSLPDQGGTIDRVFKSLQLKGYIISVKVVNEKGQFEGWNHVVYDDPVENPTLANVNVGSICNPTLTNTEVGKSTPILNTNSLLNTKEETKKEDFFLTPLKTKEKKDNNISRSLPIEKRKNWFYCKLRDYKNENPEKYPAKIYNDFYKWWTESDGKEMRFENKKNRYFEIGKRLATFWGRLTNEEKSKLWQLEKEKPKTGMLL
jgi:hypothetical protein